MSREGFVLRKERESKRRAEVEINAVQREGKPEIGLEMKLISEEDDKQFYPITHPVVDDYKMMRAGQMLQM